MTIIVETAYIIDIDRCIGNHRYFLTMLSTLMQLSSGILSLCLARRHVTPPVGDAAENQRGERPATDSVAALAQLAGPVPT